MEVIVPQVEAANYLFVQQHTHPTYYGLCSLTEQMLFCYCHSGCPSLPTPVEGRLCQPVLSMHKHTVFRPLFISPFPLCFSTSASEHLNIVSIFLTAGVLCAAPSPDGAWWRAQVIQHYKDSNLVQIRYVDYGGYVTVNLSSLKQIRLILFSVFISPLVFAACNGIIGASKMHRFGYFCRSDFVTLPFQASEVMLENIAPLLGM